MTTFLGTPVREGSPTASLPRVPDDSSAVVTTGVRTGIVTEVLAGTEDEITTCLLIVFGEI